MPKDIRMNIVDKLETFCGGRGVSFIWALEGKSEGGLIMKFSKPNGASNLTISHRIKYSDIENCNGKIDVLVKEVKEKIKELCK